ncbi:MAG TPA: spermidine/putrescine ABC transporter substrate-binding protein [Streptosporangiaceae bacterium]|nr:spermidine/putrescine ABC transporter substrate-binding protein [Streptosporangiaceae bacterium]
MAQQGDQASAAAAQQAIDPALWRGLTSKRISRRGFLAGSSAIAGAAGLSGLISACGGTSEASADTVGSPSWWQNQRLHHTVNFANWPYYIDVLAGKHPTLEYFTAITGISVNYSEPVSDNLPFYATIKPTLEKKEYTGYDVIVTTNNSPVLAELINNNWLIPLNQGMMTNFRKYAGPLVRNPPWDPGNRYTMAWQSGWTAVGYNSEVIKNPTSVGVLFEKKYAGKVGMMSDPQELGSVGLLAIGVNPATSTESDWRKAAALLQKQKSEGIVRGYYGQNYIDNLKNGNLVVSQAFSGDIFQADLTRRFKNLRLLMAHEGAMFWTDNMCIPMYAQNPKDAMTLMDYFYQPGIEAVVEYYNDYVCPVPAAKEVLLHPTGWAKNELAFMGPEIGKPPSYTANAPLVFPTPEYQKVSRNYYQYRSPEELDAWNSLFAPIASTK